MTVEIPLTKGYVAIVDDCDADLAELKWHANDKSDPLIYARRNEPIQGTKRRQKTVLLHVVIFERAFGYKPTRVDHKNGDGLLNVRSNLRHATNGQNRHNARQGTKELPNGVSTRGSRFRARISANNRRWYLGTFDTPEQAHAAYVEASLKHFGEFSPYYEQEKTERDEQPADSESRA